MSLTAWVDVAIGLSLVYLGASLFVTVINEFIAQLLNLRGKQLRDSLKSLISDVDVAKILSQSPALKPFFDSQTKKLPSYVDPNILARLLVGGLAIGEMAGNTVQQASATIDKLPDSGLKRQLQSLVVTAGTTTEELVTAVSNWADRSLTALGGRYKRNLQTISFWIGLGIAVGLNIDTIALTAHLYHDKETREAAVVLALRITEKTDKETFEKCLALTVEQRMNDSSCTPLAGLIDAVQGRSQSLGKLPIGWSDRALSPDGWIVWGSRLVGWLLTALALSLGAPFWFDLLNKVVNVRHGLSRPEVEKGLGEQRNRNHT
ncbi:hypothetical protein SAMN04244573_03788 [Azotobacter beijerinckii]|uniref:Uncharacterized protein n=1 Tax=Azotobacter beijerinckii TaxID=170623 RepID=A0A1H9PX13_9GAMM|nr:hypothetical protein [Azotobacter beijerinckii]SER52375.1 hypothetical protein SAMN04244573_03788 [Azotobacter beijerinckii]